jgi:hypothetical protein
VEGREGEGRKEVREGGREGGRHKFSLVHYTGNHALVFTVNNSSNMY